MLTDSSGQPIAADTTLNQWHLRNVDLSSFAGDTIEDFSLWNNKNGAPGNWDVYFGDISLVKADGAVIPIYNRQMMGLSTFQGPAVSNLSVITEQVADTNPLTTVTYYLDDHLGTTQVELADGGWPLWQGQFTPFGSELPDGPTTMHYKFTGKERDAESGIDNFGARYYGNTVGRWMSPDWAEKPEDVPYAKMDNPQSLNLYSYVGNNPLSRVDPDGHCWPQWLCNFVTKVKNEVLHGEFTTDTDGAKIRQLDRQEAKDRQKKQFLEEMGKHPPHVQVGIVAPIELAPLFLERTTYLYEKLGPNGEHLKYGITSNNPDGRYTTKELNGGKLKILAMSFCGRSILKSSM